MKTVHFVGIGGAGASSVAKIAIARGYNVSGCDFDTSSKYLTDILNTSTPIYSSHDISHIADADIVAASPAAIDAKQLHPEIEKARRDGKLISWQEFLGNHLMRDKFPISVAGTHGKTSTTAMIGHVFTVAGLDPTIVIGGISPNLGSNFRIGDSKYYICESDEYNCNFITYKPKLAILNNVEFEHPEYFANEDEYYRTFCDFVTTMQDGSTLIANVDDIGVLKIINMCRHFIDAHNIKIVCVSMEGRANHISDKCIIAKTQSVDETGVYFDLEGEVTANNVHLSALGRHNVQNALGVVAASHVLGVEIDDIRAAFSSFSGVKRRLQCIYNGHGTRVYDDYGHHPTEIKATLEAVRDHFPNNRLVAVVEPHMVSRINVFADEYVDALADAERVYFTKLFYGREAGMKSPDFKQLVENIGSEKAEYHLEFEETVESICSRDLKDTIIVVFGAGNSPKLTELLISELDELT